MKKLNILIVCILIMVSMSCKKPALTTSVPSLSFISYTHFYDINKKDTTGLLKMYFIDGDGDIGMHQGEIGVDFYSTLYKIKLGVWTADTFYCNYSLPYLVGQGGSGDMKGEIDITFNKIILATFPIMPPDSIKLECHIVDRAGNSSKKVLTPAIEIR